MPLFFRFAFPWCLVRLSTFSYTCLPFLYFLILIELLILLFYCFLLSFKNSLYIVDINPLSNRWFANIFSHFINCLLTTACFLYCAKVFIWYHLNYLFLLLFTVLLVSHPKKGCCQDKCYETFPLCVLQRVSQFHVLAFDSLIHFGLTFFFFLVYRVRKGINFILLCMDIQLSQYHLMKRLPLLHCVFLASFPLIGDLHGSKWILGLFLLFLQKQKKSLGFQ